MNQNHTVSSSRRRAFTRRTLLQSVGAAVPAVVVPILRSSPLSAAGTPPVRFVAVLVANGTILDNWKPTGTGAAYKMGPLLTPLEKYKTRMNLLQGVHVSVTLKPTNKSPDPHGKPWGGMLTGRELLPFSTRINPPANEKNGFGSGISVDQFIAKRHGAATRFPSLDAGVQVINETIPGSYSGSNEPVFPENDPFVLYKRVFAGGVTTTPATPATPTTPAIPTPADAALKRLLEERKSILDFVRADLNSLMPKLPADERARVDRHLTSLREIEQRLVLPGSTDPTTPVFMGGGATCAKPPQPATFAHLDPANFSKVADLHADIVAAAFACDLTGVAVLTYSGSVNNQTFPEIGLNGGHHNMSHGDDTMEPVRGRMGAITNLHAKRFAYLLDKLDSYSESNGRSLLDNSLAMWTNEISRGPDHSHENIPFVLAGSAGGYFKTGRYVVANNRPNNNLLVSVCNAVGFADVKTFGDPDYCTGPLVELA